MWVTKWVLNHIFIFLLVINCFRHSGDHGTKVTVGHKILIINANFNIRLPIIFNSVRAWPLCKGLSISLNFKFPTNSRILSNLSCMALLSLSSDKSLTKLFIELRALVSSHSKKFQKRVCTNQGDQGKSI